MQKHNKNHDGNDGYREGSISLGGAVAMGTGVMIGAGIFALTGQIAQLAGPLVSARPSSLGAIVTSAQRLQLHQDVERLALRRAASR